MMTRQFQDDGILDRAFESERNAASMTWNAGPEFGDKSVQGIFFVPVNVF